MNIRGVPALIVNVKYLINLGSIKNDSQFNANLVELIEYLSTKTN
jgi:thiol:disulfide interchange protein DsbA